MTRATVSLADQAVVIWPEDADELVDLLLDASWVIGHLASVPAAEQACARAPAAPCDCAGLALDLKLAAAALDDAATAGRDNAYLTMLARKSAARPKKSRDAPRKGNAPKKGRDKLNSASRENPQDAKDDTG